MEISTHHQLFLKNIGDIYRIKGQYKQAIDTYEKSLEIRIDLEQNEYIAESLNNLILTCYLDNDSDKASDFLNQLKKIKIKDDDQCALRDLYSLIIYDKFDDDNLMNRVVENAEAIENSSYETYYFIHKVSNDDKYLNMARS